MAIKSYYQSFPSSVIPWNDVSATGIWGSTIGIIDQWVSDISGNASIIANDMVPVKKRDQLSSTDGTNFGYVYQFPDSRIPDPTTYGVPLTVYQRGSETSFSSYVTSNWRDNTSSSGYGSYTSGSGNYSGTTIGGVSNFDRELLIFTEDEDGKEFITVGMKRGDALSHTATWTVARDTNGYWFGMANSYGLCPETYNTTKGNYYTGHNGTDDSDPTYRNAGIAPLALYPSTGLVTNLDYFTAVWYPASEALYSARGSSAVLGAYGLMPNGDTIIETGYQGIAVRY